MKFNKELFLEETNKMLSNGFQKIQVKDDVIYTLSLCIDVNSQYSSLHFDTKDASDNFCGKGNRNYSPADFKYGDFVSIDNKSFNENWEYNTDGKCWEEITPLLDKICKEIIQNRLEQVKTEQDFIFTCSGPNDWCEFEYTNKESL